MLYWLPALFILITHGSAGTIESGRHDLVLRLVAVSVQLTESPAHSVSAALVGSSSDEDAAEQSDLECCGIEAGSQDLSSGFAASGRVRDGPRVI